jgi:hypothetical protein
VASSSSGRKSGEVANPDVTKVPNHRPNQGDYLPIVTTTNGEKIIGFPGGTTPDGQPIMADEIAVTDLEGYPYKTYQGAQGNCSPRAFEVLTGIYSGYTEGTLTKDVESVTVGSHKFITRPNTVKPQVGQAIGYRVYEDREVYHTAIVTGYNENGDVIVATGWRSRPYQVVPQERIRHSYQEVQ